MYMMRIFILLLQKITSFCSLGFRHQKGSFSETLAQIKKTESTGAFFSFLKKKWVIHGGILLAMVIVCRIRFECILLWNLGYALYFAGKIAGGSLSGIKNRIGKILVFILLLTVSVPGVVFLCIPSLLLCRIHSLRNPEYARDLPVYTAEKNPS